MEEKKKKIFRGQIPTAVFYLLFGLCLALMPVETVNVLCKVVFGLVLIGAGIYHVVIFVLEKENSTILDLFSGVIVLVIGIFLFMNPTVVVKLLTLMLGAFILVDSIWMLRGSLKLKKRKQGVWKAFLVESLIFIGLGVLILVNPFSEIKMTVQVSGWIFVANGVLDIIFYLILCHGLKKETAPDEKDTGKNVSASESLGANADMSEEAKSEKAQSVGEIDDTIGAETVSADQDSMENWESKDVQELKDPQETGENQETQEEVLEEWKD
ncbi:DUF308 domain-containing protein [Blautia sp. HCP3S3_H10_1]|uniref:HdeD family acid-resistance protein n=1 Tax=unclassified Blautia TaxID=2648079 RepID=UPI003F93B682|nr:DUF308 domain-containing protein [Clostridia bacterium]